ncbi:MAG TPA: hypothetical protein VIM53_00325 [Candidatus Saccharimonadales bacterium]
MSEIHQEATCTDAAYLVGTIFTDAEDPERHATTIGLRRYEVSQYNGTELPGRCARRDFGGVACATVCEAGLRLQQAAEGFIAEAAPAAE